LIGYKSKIKIVCISIFLINSVFSGCIEEKRESDGVKNETTNKLEFDQSTILPDWNDGDYHDYYGTMQLLNDLNEKYPDLVYIYSIGASVLGKQIWCIRITNENSNNVKSSCLIDGCIHGVEWESGEACLYLAEYLLINFGKNYTINDILNKSIIYIVPLVNPDGRQNNEVGNDHGVDLNRNFDVFFGRLRSRCFRFGELFGKIRIPYVKFPPNNPFKWWRNCGRYAFSEPESRALRDLMKSLNNHDFSFYVNCHTAWHNIMTPIPWSKWIFNPPFVITSHEKTLFDHVKEWVETNTEYEADRTEENNVGGCSDYWCFKEFRIPAFTFEILSMDYDAWSGEQKHDNLVHWMKTTLPFFMFLLINIDNLRQWKTPNIQPPLPEGIPPESI
jgi:hypothetical protein